MFIDISTEKNIIDPALREANRKVWNWQIVIGMLKLWKYQFNNHLHIWGDLFIFKRTRRLVLIYIYMWEILSDFKCREYINEECP